MNFTKRLLFFGALALLAACGKKADPVVTKPPVVVPPATRPAACFTPNPASAIVEVNQTVSFLGCNSPTDATYLYDFGDSSGTSTERSPTHTYARPGKYPVKLIAYNATDKKLKDSTTTVITVKQRYIESIEIQAINLINPGSKKPWDYDESGADTAGPDVYITVARTSAPANFLFTSPVEDNITSATPTNLKYDLKTGGVDIRFGGETFDFIVNDKDPTINEPMAIFDKRNPLLTSTNPIIYTSGDGKTKISIKTYLK